MKKVLMRCMVICLCIGVVHLSADAQKRTAKKKTTARKTATTKKVAQTVAPVVVDTAVIPTPPPVVDSIPIATVKKSLRNDDAFEKNLIKDRVPLPYENIREDDVIYMQRLWRDIDTREKMNMPFRYAADDDAGNQRFISILLKAIQDGPDNGGVTAFNAIDDRFTTPMTRAEVGKTIGGEPISVPVYNDKGEVDHYETKAPEINLDSFYKFRIKEEVIFDKESSRLVWRILGIAPVKNIYTSTGEFVGESEMFWVYYPDMRPIFAKYEVYNNKNYGARMSWEELFESRMFHGRIVKSTIDNPFDQYIKDQMGFKASRILQLLEGDNIKDKIFNYEQNLWSY